MELRAGTPDDAEPIAALVLAVAHHAYADLEPVRVHGLDPDDEAREWHARLADPVHLTRVVSLGGRLVGASCWRRPERAGDERAGSTDAVDSRASTETALTDDLAVLTHLLVHPAAQNAGVGSVLLRDAEDALRQAGGRAARTTLHRDAWWAARFLEGRGWAPADTSAGEEPHVGASPARAPRRGTAAGDEPRGDEWRRSL